MVHLDTNIIIAYFRGNNHIAGLIKQRLPEVAMSSIFDNAHPELMQSVYNWAYDLEMELGNAGLDNPIYHEHRLRYTREFLAMFPDESADRYVNFMRAQGEALWRLGRRAEAEAVYAELVKRFPNEGWGYIGWADEYWLFDDSSKEYEKAEAILKRALARPNLQDREDVLERLEDLYKEWGKPEKQAALPKPPAKKPRRNDPCWCGSGKKYKHCHMRSDRKAKRSG